MANVSDSAYLFITWSDPLCCSEEIVSRFRWWSWRWVSTARNASRRSSRQSRRWKVKSTPTPSLGHCHWFVEGSDAESFGKFWQWTLTTWTHSSTRSRWRGMWRRTKSSGFCTRSESRLPAGTAVKTTDVHSPSYLVRLGRWWTWPEFLSLWSLN